MTKQPNTTSDRPSSGLFATPTKVFLVGYRACGKTEVGQLLALRLGWRFMDMDREISKRTNMSIKDLVASHGWDYFRRRERELLRELAEQPLNDSGLVVATGGGAVLQQDLWAAIKTEYPVLWLSAEPATIAARLSADTASDEQRPCLTDRGLLGEISDVVDQRRELYRRAAHQQMDTSTMTPATLVADIIAWLNNRQAEHTGTTG